MIPDATLSSHDHGNCELCDQQEAEIRRLRENLVIAHANFQGMQARVLDVEAVLAAHQAVVRELATELQRYVGDLGLPVLADPLVVAARTEGRDEKNRSS